MNLRKLKVMVTGSSGTIGNCLCEVLLNSGAEVIGVDYHKNRWNPEVNRLTLNIDLRDQEQIKRLPRDVDHVVHLAANARVFKLVEHPDLARDNFLTLYNILEHIRKNNIGKIFFSSSREVYGNSGNILHSEEESFVKHCESSYTATKIGGEALIHSYNQCYGIDFVIGRFSNVYGKYDYTDRVIPFFISRALANQDIQIFGQDKVLDFTYVEDTVQGIIKSLSLFPSVKNEVFNIATQQGYSIERIAEIIIELTNSKSQISFNANRPGEVCRFVADISKAKAVMDYSPQYSLVEGIGKTIDWYTPRIDEYRKIMLDGDE